MRPDPISPSFAEQTDTPKVVGSRIEVLAQFIGLQLVHDLLFTQLDHLVSVRSR